ncbi:MAG: MBL fold metallo-hydrolase [Proteobacteria bacterium]|nr:MBL fold metallo-hydrolase [Pseudomonadota bacterium]
MNTRNSIENFRLAVVVALAFGAGAALAQDVSSDAQMHAERGLQAAEVFPGYASLCDLDMTFRNVNVLVTDPPRARTAPAQPAAYAAADTATQQRTRTVSAPPAARVFDNLFFVGSESVSSWLLGTEEGYILIDAMNSDEEAESIIEAGIVSLGLNPAMIRYLLITHAHGDHFGGYQYISDTYSPEIVMSELDWDLASRLAEHPRFGLPPERDVSVNDGDQLTAGTTTLDIRVTPGHTPGTISPVFTVYDNGTPYRAVLWGGTGFNFGPNYEQMRSYAASANRMKQLAVEENVQVFFSNHSRRDGSLERIAELAERGPGDPHPFVQGEELYAVFDVLEQCALAQAARIRDGDG